MAAKHFSRRWFLGGAAVAVSLPFFESLGARKAFGQETAAPKRFLAHFVPNGFDMADFRPVGSGPELVLGPMMQSLEPLKDQVLVLTGLQNEKQDRAMGDHCGGIGSFLTGRTVFFDAERMNGASIDQLIADQIGGSSKLKSLELSGEPGFADGYCDSGYRCAVGNHIAFDASGVPLPKLYETGAIFDRLFAGVDPGASAAEAERRRVARKSVLDAVLSQAESLSGKLSATDKLKLDEYLSAVRDVERRIDNGSGTTAGCQPPMRTEGYMTDDVRHQVLNELIALAFQCDVTRVVSLMWGNMTSNRNYAFLGASGGHHDISHHGGNQALVDKLKVIGRWEVEQLAALMTRLNELPDVDGRTVLDNTLIFYSSDVSDGDAHNHDDMPVLVAGGAAGFTMGRHVTYTDKPYFAQLFMAMAQAYGASVTSFGEHGTAPLPGLV